MDEPLVINEADVEIERWDDPSRGPVIWRTIFSGDRTPTSQLTMGIAELPPGQSDHGPRHHHEPAELYYVIEGEGVMDIDGVTTAVRAGTAVFIPSNADHRLANTGPTTLRLLYSFAVDSFADVEYVFPAADGL